MKKIKIGNWAYLFHGDCLDIMPKLKSESVDLIVTDPPYKLTSGGLSGVCTGGIFDPNTYDNKGELFDVENFSSWMPLVHRTLKEDADFYVMSNDKNLYNMMLSAFDSEFKLHNILVWVKSNKTPNRWYMKQCEFILYFWKGKAKRIANAGTSNVFVGIEPKIGDRLHPSEKPSELMEIMIENSCPENGLVLDLFMGSGSTGEACFKTSRRFIGIEKDEKYFDIAVERLRNVVKLFE